MELLTIIKSYKRILIIFFAPLLLLPLIVAAQSKEASCAFCILLMTVYWTTEVYPLAVTAFLPLVLFPFLNVMTAKEVGGAYINNTSWLYMGGIIVAIAIEKTMLHKRIAIKLLLLVGTSQRRLMLGFMIPTYFLSMWISNTATTAMMLPILNGVILQMEECSEKEGSNMKNSDDVNVADEAALVEYEDGSNRQLRIQDKTRDKRMKRFALGLTLCIPYSASIGGITTLTGSPTNIVLSGQFNDIFPEAPFTLSFGIWLLYNFSTSFVLLLLGYLWMMWSFIGFGDFPRNIFRRKEQSTTEENIRKMLHGEYKALGGISWREGVVLVIFCLMAFLWFFRDPGFMPGWNMMFADGYISDSTTAMSLVLLLFLFPERRPTLFGGSPLTPSDVEDKTILSWDDVHKNCQWSVLLLIGGGFALAKAAVKSNLTLWIATKMTSLSVLPTWLTCLIVTIIASLFTECTSNVAAASIFVPVLSQMSIVIRVHPLYLLIPAIVSTSLAFMLPVATPPNALAFASGRVKVPDMMKAGWVMNILGVLVVNFFVNTLGVAIFNVHQFPEWANTIPINSTYAG